MNLESYLKKNKLSDEEKLLKYFEEMKNIQFLKIGLINEFIEIEY